MRDVRLAIPHACLNRRSVDVNDRYDILNKLWISSAAQTVDQISRVIIVYILILNAVCY